MKGFGSFVVWSLIYISLVILVKFTKAAEDIKIEKQPQPTLGAFVQSLIPKSISPQVQILADLVKLKGQRFAEVGIALLGLGLAMGFKFFLLWVGPYLTSAPVQAIQAAIAKEASRELLSNAVMTGVSTLQSLYG